MSEKLSAPGILLKALVLLLPTQNYPEQRDLNSPTLKALWNLLPYRDMTKAHSLFISNLVNSTGHGLWDMDRNEKIDANKEQRRRVIPEKDRSEFAVWKATGQNFKQTGDQMGTEQKEKLISLCLAKRVSKNANWG